MRHLPEPLRFSSWEAGLHKDTQLNTVNTKATLSCFPACNPFAHHHIHQAAGVRNETCRCHRQCCCGKLQLHSKASSKQKKVKSSPYSGDCCWPSSLLCSLTDEHQFTPQVRQPAPLCSKMRQIQDFIINCTCRISSHSLCIRHVFM